MKKIWYTFLLAVLAVGICCLCLIYVVDVSDKALDSVTKIETYVEQGNYDFAREEAKALNEFWTGNHTILSTIVHHDTLAPIEESVAMINTSLESSKSDGDEEFWAESTKAVMRIKNLGDVELPSVANIL